MSSPSANAWVEPAHDVVPISGIDADGGLGKMVTVYCLHADGPMDPEKLRDAMEQLVTKKWRILGARFARNAESGMLEYHVPKSFDATTPAIDFSKVSIPSPIAAYLPPRKVSHLDITLHSRSEHLGYYSVRRFKSVAEYLAAHPPPPLIAWRVITFTDATLIGLEVPHATIDTRGFSYILRALVTIVNTPDGKGIDLVPEIPLHVHHLNDLFWKDDTVVEKQPWGTAFLTKLNYLRVMAAAAWEKYREPKDSIRYIHIPRSEINRMKAEAQLQVDADLKRGESRIKLTTNDVIVAWTTKACFGSRPPNSKVKISCSTMLDLRERLPKYFADGPYKEYPFLHNAIIPQIVPPLITVEEIQKSSLGQLAKASRLGLNVSPSTLASNLKWLCPRLAKREILLFTPPAQTFTTSSALAMRLCHPDVNFSGALTDPSYSGKFLDIHGGYIRAENEPEMLDRRNVTILEDGERGGAWVKLCVPDADWEKGILGSLKRADALDEQTSLRAKL